MPWTRFHPGYCRCLGFHAAQASNYCSPTKRKRHLTVDYTQFCEIPRQVSYVVSRALDENSQSKSSITELKLSREKKALTLFIPDCFKTLVFLALLKVMNCIINMVPVLMEGIRSTTVCRIQLPECPPLTPPFPNMY